MSWRIVNLGELVDEFSFRPNDLDIDVSLLEFYGVSNTDGIIPTKNAAEDKAEKYKILEKDCFAYNPYRVNVGSIALLEDDIKGLISPAYVVFKPKPKSIIPQLLLMFLKSPEGLRQIKIHARGTVRQALRFNDLCKIELSLPDYDEQIEFFKKIKETESVSKNLTVEFTHQLDLVKELRQVYLKEAMQGKLVPQDSNDEPASILLEKIRVEKQRLVNENKIRKQKPISPIEKDEIPFEVPENWEWCRLGELASFLNGYAFKSSWYKDVGIPVLRNVNMGVGEINWKDVAKIPESIASEYPEYSLEAGDILLSLDRPIINAGLKVAQVKTEDLPCLLLQRVLKTSPIIASNQYVFIWFQSELFIKSINPGRSIGIPHVSHNDVAEALIPLPPISEQQRIVLKLEELMAYCDDLEASIKESQEQNELLLQQVLNESLGLKLQKEAIQKETSKKEKAQESKFDPNTTLMEIVELLKKHGKLHAEELWKMSKYPDDIDAFYADLKKQIELNKMIKESAEKGYLELV